MKFEISVTWQLFTGRFYSLTALFHSGASQFVVIACLLRRLADSAKAGAE